MQRKRSFAGIGFAAIVAVVLAGCLHLPAVRDVTSAVPPSVVVAGGTVLPQYNPSEPLLLSFTEPMDKLSTESALKVDPVVPFSLEWRDARNVEVRFSQLERDETYAFTVAASAKSREGLDLTESVTFMLMTAGDLAVTEVQPADGAEDVPLETVITVVFNHPVVDLSSEIDQEELPQPLTITPSVDGSGEWINTAIYRFTPSKLLDPLTEYTVAVDPDLVDASGAGLAEPYEWSFTTVEPQVLSISPAPTGEGDAATQFARPTDPIKIEFAQPMDRESVEEALEVRIGSASGADVPGRIRWAGNTVVFTPTQPWQRSTMVYVRLEGATAEGGAELPAVEWTFEVIRKLRLVRTEPADDSTDVAPGTSVRLVFSAPIDYDSLEKNLTIEPEPSYMYVYWDTDKSAYVSFEQDAATEYTVTVGSQTRDTSGWRIGQDVSFSFTTGDWSPSFSLNESWYPWAFGASDEPKAYASFRNISRLDFTLYSLDPDTFVRLTTDWEYQQDFVPPRRDIIRSWSEQPDTPRNEWGSVASPLAEDGGSLPTGLYYLVVTAPEFPRPEAWEMSRQVIAVCGGNVTMKWGREQALAWVTGWDDGQPRAGVPVSVLNSSGKELASGKTDSSGVFLDAVETGEPWGTYFVFAGTPGDDDFGVTTSDWTEGINPWRYEIYLSGYSSPYALYMYTDRDIYRPGQTVYYKGIVRYDDDARYSLPTDIETLPLTCTDSQGQEIASEDVKLSEMGTFYGSITLAEDAPLGYYYIWVPVDTDLGYGMSATFQVAEYRRPEYEISVVTDEAEYLDGDDIAVTAEASYYFGGAVSDAAVRWAVLREDYFFNWQGEGYYDFTDYDYWLDSEYYGVYGEAIAEGEGETDGEGRFTFKVPAEISDRRVSQLYTIEVTVTDVNNQEVSARTSVLVHKGAFYVGLWPQTYVSSAGEEALVDVITVDSQSEPVAKQEVTLTFYEHRWYNVREKVGDYYEWTTTVEDIEVDRQTVTTDGEGRAVVGFTPEGPGTYKVVAVAEDDFGNEIRSSTYLWVAGEGYVSWQMPEDATIQLITDKKSYDVGDTAQVLIPSTYEGSVAALITSERGRVLDYQVIDVESSSQVIEIPITEEYAPNVYFVAVLMRGEDEDASLPPFQVGFASVSVSTAALELSLELQADRDAPYEPGDEAVFSVTAKDAEGNPVQAEVSLNLVDKAVLALTGEMDQSLVDFFYMERNLGVQTALTMAISAEELERAAAAMGKGGGGGGDGGEVRTEFPETAYWEPALQTDRSGEATVSVELPDNLTTWRLEAKAVTADTLVAEEYLEIVTSKDLMLMPIVPRFMVAGDEAMLGAVVHNNTAKTLTVDVGIEVDGLVSEGETQRVTIPAAGRVSVTWPVSAVDVGEGSITIRAQSGALTDAVKQTLPVYAMTVAEIVATSGQVDAGETVVEGVSVPGRYEEGELAIQVDASLAAGMVPGLTYLKHYPYECVEQTLSRFLPNVVTSRALRRLGIDDFDLTVDLAQQVAIGLQRLYGNQHDDGGWGWWFADESNPFLSAYVVYGLAQARDAGYSVDDGVYERALAFLVEALHRRSSSDGSSMNLTNDDRAYIAYVLAEAGEGDLGASVSLYEKRSDLSNRGKAYLLMALAILSPDEESRLDALVGDLKGTAVLAATTTYWQDKAAWRTMGTDIVTTAVVVQALSRVAPDDAILPGAVRWLMEARQDGHWRSTYETATTIMGLTDFMVASGELEANYSWSVAVNGEEEAAGTYTADNLTESKSLVVAIADLLRDESNKIAFSREEAEDGTDTGAMYYTMSLRYYPPAEELEAVNSGIIVTREYRAVDAGDERVSEAAVNEMVEVKLTIIAPNDLYHVVVEDPFPAGCEGVDTSLRTTTVVGVQPEVTSKGDPWGWWWFSHTEIRDDKAVLFATFLPAGTYEYTYYIRASVVGEYGVRPASAYQMYFPDVYGHSEGAHFTVTEAEK